MASAAEKQVLVAAAASTDLLYLLDDAELDTDSQHLLVVTHGFKSVRLVSGMEESRAGIRTFCNAILGIANDTPGGRLSTAKIIGVWESAKEIIAQDTRLKVEAKSMGVTRQASQPERSAMRKLYELRWGKVGGHHIPSISYLSMKLEEVEINEPMASKLDEATSAEENDDFSVTQSHDAAGRILFVKKRLKGVLPTSPEEFRAKLKVEGATWCLLALKFPSRVWLRDICPDDWLVYCEFFLGKQVYLMAGPDGPVTPDWSTFLSYEFECRRKVFSAVRDENASLKQGLIDVCKCSQTKELFFISPLVLKKRKNPEPPSKPDVPDGRPPKTPKGKGKGKGKGKDKGGEPGGKARGKGKKSWAWKTPDGRELCFVYNNGNECDGSCGRVHACRVKGCTEQHPAVHHVY